MSNHWYPNGTGVTIQTEDGPLDLADVSWQIVRADGFIVSIGHAALPGGEFIASGDQFAHEVYAPKKWEQLKREGYVARAQEHHASCAQYAAQQRL